jgi:hypothetical protein
MGSKRSRVQPQPEATPLAELLHADAVSIEASKSKKEKTFQTNIGANGFVFRV